MKKVFFILIITLFVFSAVYAGDMDARRSYLESIWTDHYQPVSVEQIWGNLDDEQKVFVAGAIKKLVLSQIPQDVFANPDKYLSGIQDEKFKAYIKQMTKVVMATDPQQIAKVLDSLDKDHLIMGSPELFKTVQAYLGGDFKARSFDVESTPAYLKDDYQTVKSFSLLNDSDPVYDGDLPHSGFEPVTNGFSMTIGKLHNLMPLSKSTIVNSIRLSQVLNQLSNYGSDGIYSTIEFAIGGKEYTLKKPVDLINVLKVSDEYETVAFETRMGVDYGGYYLQQSGSYFPIEIPSFVTTNINSKKIYFPANHAEYVLALFKKGEIKPTALVKWYMGIPTDNKLHQGTIWKPAIWTHASWTGTKMVATHTDTTDLRNLVHSAMYLMKLFNHIQSNNKFPMNGYAMLAVCNDSVSIMRTIMGDSPMTSAYPNLRSIKYDRLYADTLSKFGGHLRLDSGILNVPTDVYPEYYPHSVNMKRLSLSFPYRDSMDIIGYSHNEVFKALKDIDYSFAGYID